jgi:flavin reductase (DIM6/NTAB) family NADH-FMN oxidoreductase RutF
VERTPSIADVFSLVDREVWIVTAQAEGRRGGLAATWVSQSSIDPKAPTVAIALAVNHFTRELVDQAGAFALHLITDDQIDLAWRFALGSGRDRDKLAGLATRPGETGCPILQEALAWLECRVYDIHDGGDRIYYWADVVAGGRTGDGRPLRERRLFAAANDQQRAALGEGLLADIEFGRRRRLPRGGCRPRGS